jgi:hypothetical protein
MQADVFPDIASLIRATALFLCLTGKSPISCPAPSAKIFLFLPDPNHRHILRHPASSEGRFAIVTDVRRDAVAADGALTNALEADGEAVWS